MTEQRYGVWFETPTYTGWFKIVVSNSAGLPHSERPYDMTKEEAERYAANTVGAVARPIEEENQQ